MYEVNPHMLYFVRKFCTPKWTLFDRKIDYHNLTFVLSGSCVFYSGEEVFQVHAGEAVFIRDGANRIAETAGMECVAFSFRTDEPFPWHSRVFTWKMDEKILYWFRDYELHWFSLDDNDRKLYCRGLFLLILHRMIELSRTQPENAYVSEIRRYLEQHFLERITVAGIAAHIGLNATYCGALFKKETGKTILQTVNLMRINRASELLRYGGVRVTDAALSCGFSDVFYFSRIFKKITGESPESFIHKAEQQTLP